jgi:hypothetical protein
MPSSQGVDLALKIAKIADATGLDFIGSQDHPYNRDFLESWTLLTMVGARTERVRLISDVSPLPMRPLPCSLKQWLHWIFSRKDVLNLDWEPDTSGMRLLPMEARAERLAREVFLCLAHLWNSFFCSLPPTSMMLHLLVISSNGPCGSTLLSSC